MRLVSLRSLALATVASLAMATPSSAITILQYGQTNPNDFKTATVAGGVTTITTSSAAASGSIPITITNIGGIPLAGPLVINGFETFTNVRSTGPATLTGTTIDQPFSGTVAFTSLAGGAGINFLTATFTGATLTGLAQGGSASLIASEPPGTITYTSSDPRVLAALAALGPLGFTENFSISFSGINQPPGLSIIGTGANATIGPFSARNAGTFDAAAVVPEPSGLAMAGTAMLASLGCIGWRRRQSSRA